MPKVAKELKPLAVQALTEPGHWPVGVVPGLALQVTPSGARSWVLRIRTAGGRRDIGLGGYPAVTLADARTEARRVRLAVKAGTDPVSERKAQRSAALAARGRGVSFRKCSAACIKAQTPRWKNAKHAQQWTNTLETYAHPVIGDMLVGDVEKSHILQVLEPIWTTKPETASRVRHRIGLVLSYAMQAGHRPEGLNPAAWKGMDKLLPERAEVAEVKHHEALPIDGMGEFMVNLRSAEGQGARALEFTILTAARSGEVRGATWAEIDLAAKTWTVPASRMKGKREHRVALSSAAVALLQSLPQGKPDDVVFPGPKGTPLSDMTLSAVMRRMGLTATVHGFRSTFRDWAAERTTYPGEMAEMALAHVIADKTEEAYRRGDMLARRVRMMEEWAAFIGTAVAPASGSSVVRLLARG